jgi:cyclase
VGFVRTGSGLICIDMPMMPKDARHWFSRIRRVTDEPVLSLVQTDYDQERVASTCLFNVPIIAHEAAWEKMLKIYKRDKAIQQMQDLLGYRSSDPLWKARMPEVTFTEQMILNKGTREIHLLHGGGHSPATCMVHLPDERLIFTGDVVFNDGHPTMAEAESREWLTALTRLRKMAVDTIIPGHGATCEKEATYPLTDYIRDMRAEVRRGFQAGRTKSDTAKTVVPKFLDRFPYDKSERECICKRIKRSSYRIYDEYRNAEKKKTRRQRPRRRRR